MLRSVLRVAAYLATACLAPPLTSAYAQTHLEPPPNPSIGDNLTGAFNPITSPQFFVCGLTIGFGLIVLFVQYSLLRRVNHLSADDVLKNFSILIVIVGASVLVIAGYNSQQTAQAFGLFGTIIGYLLGRSAGRKESGTERANGE